MIPARLSFRYEFTPVPSCGSVFVYMIPTQNLEPERVIPVRVHPGYCTGARFSFRYENSFRCHVNAVRLFAPAWNHSPGSLERVAHVQSLISNPIWRHLYRHNHVGRNEVSIHLNTIWNHNVWFQKISIPPPRRELEIPEGWGVGGSMAQEIPEGRRGEWLDKFPEGQLHVHVRRKCSKL